MAKQQFQTVRGMYDILPERRRLFDYVTDAFAGAVVDAGYGRIETPLLEDEGVFLRTQGQGTDLVDKELYTLVDRSDKHLALRPEGTAAIARAYI